MTAVINGIANGLGLEITILFSSFQESMQMCFSTFFKSYDKCIAYYDMNTTQSFKSHLNIFISYYLLTPSLSSHLKCTFLTLSYIVAKAVNINTHVVHQYYNP